MATMRFNVTKVDETVDLMDLGLGSKARGVLSFEDGGNVVAIGEHTLGNADIAARILGFEPGKRVQTDVILWRRLVMN